MGADGLSYSVPARDAFGLGLYYFNKQGTDAAGSPYNLAGNAGSEYIPIWAATNPFIPPNSADTSYRPLYNGNIAAATVNVPVLGNALLYNYRYDQMSRLTAMQAYTGINNANGSLAPVAVGDYKENAGYDPNGNILSYVRHGNPAGGSPLQMDTLFYHYQGATNRLDYVQDTVPAANYAADIDGQNPGNYRYDSIGNLTKDVKNGVDRIFWNVYGKITKVVKKDTSINYTYDAAGNRISKAVVKPTTTITTWYVRDASGNTMGVYTNGDNTVNSGQLTQAEVYMYGSSRLGVVRPNINVQTVATPLKIPLRGLDSGYLLTFVRGQKFFELSNHLGNVLATVADRKIGVAKADGVTVSYYTAVVVSAQDYYPGGMLEPGRQYSTGTQYRYGFNGQEKSDEIGSGLTTAQYWEYDARIGRRWNVDPKIEDAPGFSPYSCLGDNPILHDDPEGDFWHIIAGGVIGALIGGAIEAGTELYKDHSITNWKAVAGASVQGAWTGAAAAATGGASFVTSTAAKVVVVGASAIAANVAGGAANRAIQGKKTTGKDVVIDAAVGAAGAVLGYAANKVVTKVLAQGSKVFSDQAKGKIGELLTKTKYLAKGYVSTGTAEVEATTMQRLSGQPRVAQYDHAMKRITNWVDELTVESKFNSSKLNPLQRNAMPNVSTPGGLIINNPTNVTAGKAANTLVNGVTGAAGAQINKN